MTVYCAADDCIYNGNKHHCTAKSINLSDGYWHTVNEGFKHFNICKTYEKSEEADRLEKAFERYMRECIN